MYKHKAIYKLIMLADSFYAAIKIFLIENEILTTHLTIKGKKNFRLLKITALT